MDVLIKVTGVSPLLMHNPRLSDPDNEIVREMKKLTKKTNKTEEDRREIERLEWYGGLYEAQASDIGEKGEGNVVAHPTSKLRKSIIEAAKLSKLGTKVEQALLFDAIYTPLVYEGPRDIDELWKSQKFISRLSVVIDRKRVMRSRPQFMPWRWQVSGMLLTEVMDMDDFVRCAELAGRAKGVGDNRVNGYGRYTVEVAFG